MYWVSAGVPSNNRFVGFDVETTGLSPENGDRVVQIGLVAVDGDGRELERLVKVLNPQAKAISPAASRTNGFTNEQLANETATFADIVDDITAFCSKSFLFAHKFSFDARFIGAEYDRTNARRRNVDGFCTKILASTANLTGYQGSLAGLARLFKIEQINAPDAGEDAKIAVLLGLKMVEKLGGFDKAWRHHNAVLSNPKKLNRIKNVSDADRKIYSDAQAFGVTERLQKAGAL